MNMEKPRPEVGMGIYVANGKGQILLTQRPLSLPHLPGVWSAPGGHLEIGESFFNCAKRELKEETNLDLNEVEILGVVNNIFPAEGKHYVNVDVLAKGVSGELKNTEPEKCEKLDWFALDSLPDKLMQTTPNLFKTYPEVKTKLVNFNSFV